jgi:hypothetical protein
MYPSKASKQQRLYRMTFGVRKEPATSTFDTKQVSKPTSDTLMETPKTPIL